MLLLKEMVRAGKADTRTREIQNQQLRRKVRDLDPVGAAKLPPIGKQPPNLMQQLDPEGMCTYKLFREHCTFFNNAFVKDLTRLGRNMEDVIIVDNSPVAYLFQPENALPAVSWYEDPKDDELSRLATLLERMAYEGDVRKVIRTIV